LTASGTINNPTLFDAQPLIRVYGTGSITVNGVTITISEADGYTDIDCELMECYKGNVLKNYAVSLDSTDFPVLSAGDNAISMSGVTSAIITPRWWTI
jgi:phage-related protein